MSTYQDLYSFKSISTDQSDTAWVEHKDGSISCAYIWSGLDYDGSTSDLVFGNRINSYREFLRFVGQKKNIVIENHFYRENNGDKCEQYYQYGLKNIKPDRNPEFALRLRRQIADHLARYSRLNTIVTVLTFVPSFSLFKSRTLQKGANELTAIINKANTVLGGIKLLSADPVNALILGESKPYNDRFFLHDLIKKPEWVDGLIKVGNTYYRVFTLFDYPDANTGWFQYLARKSTVDVHVSQTLKPVDRALETRKSSENQRRSQNAAADIGGESVAQKIGEQIGFRGFVEANDLALFGNNYNVIFSSTNKQDLIDHSAEFEHKLTVSDALFYYDNQKIAFKNWRISTPFCGHLASFLRPDHEIQVANMAPIFKPYDGDMDNPQYIALTDTSNVVGLSYPKNGVHHGIRAAKTGSGKTVDEALEIAQLYPLGFNFYITEVGRGYEWLVKAFGGQYFVLDANTSVISPFVEYDFGFGENEELSADMVATALKAIMPILRGRTDYDDDDKTNIHYEAAAGNILELVYSPDFRNKELNAPTLQTYLELGQFALENELFEGQQLPAAKEMIENLYSFLDTKEGSVFKKADSIDFTAGIIGIDFSVLLEGNNDNLAKYLLIFVGSRFKQLAFANSEQTFVRFDEYHEFTAIDRKLCSKLERQMTRRGRKVAGFFGATSQECGEIIGTEKDRKDSNSIINQITHKKLMYYGTEHGNLSEVFKLPPRAASIWENYQDPITNKFNYRQCLYYDNNNFYALWLSSPKIISLLTDSSPKSVANKPRIWKQCNGDILLALDQLDKVLNDDQ